MISMWMRSNHHVYGIYRNCIPQKRIHLLRMLCISISSINHQYFAITYNHCCIALAHIQKIGIEPLLSLFCLYIERKNSAE